MTRRSGVSRSDEYDSLRDKLLDEPDFDADADRQALERLRWALESGEETDE